MKRSGSRNRKWIAEVNFDIHHENQQSHQFVNTELKKEQRGIKRNAKEITDRNSIIKGHSCVHIGSNRNKFHPTFEVIVKSHGDQLKHNPLGS